MPVKPAAKPHGKVLGLNKWAWAGVVALGIVVFLYFRHKSSTAAAADTGNAPAPDANATDTASLGGTPSATDSGVSQSPDDSAIIGDLLTMMLQSQQQFGALLPTMTASGLGSGATGSVPASAPASAPDTSAATSGGIVTVSAQPQSTPDPSTFTPNNMPSTTLTSTPTSPDYGVIAMPPPITKQPSKLIAF